MKQVTWLLTIAVFTLTGPSRSGHGEEQKPEPRKVQELMRRKLENSQKVLEGVALNDFKLIDKHAEELLQISKAAEWKVRQTPEYELFSDEFRRKADGLIKNAREKNPDGAALKYVELTLTCVRCHQYVRDAGRVRLDDAPAKAR